ncbi:MAG: sulfurtransferase TusA family protein [Clostridia bacterium]|nr:sulfurtransferase TusA family protein [Clostridia bacterium]
MTKLDACGLSCPEPVIMISQAMKSGDSEYEIKVDNRVSRENVTRYAEHQGYTVSVTESDREFTLKITK